MNREECLQRLSNLSEKITEILPDKIVSDCFCGIVTNDKFDIDDRIIEFIENAVNNSIEQCNKVLQFQKRYLWK